MKVDCRESECGGPAKQALHVNFTLPPVPSRLLAVIFSTQRPRGQGKGSPILPAHPLGRRCGKHMVTCYSPQIPLRWFSSSFYRTGNRHLGTLKDVPQVAQPLKMSPACLTPCQVPALSHGLGSHVQWDRGQPCLDGAALSGRCARISCARWTHGC